MLVSPVTPAKVQQLTPSDPKGTLIEAGCILGRVVGASGQPVTGVTVVPTTPSLAGRFFYPKDDFSGTQASTALALDALFTGERVFAAAISAGALSVDALKGSAKPFDPRISQLRGQPGQIAVAARIADYLSGSEILTSHVRSIDTRVRPVSHAGKVPVAILEDVRRKLAVLIGL